MCYQPRPVTFHKYTKINEETGEIYETKRPRFLTWDKITPENALNENIYWLPCGKCEECLSSRSSDTATRAMLEAQKWPKNTFLTLTYSNDNLPKHRSLKKRDLQLFWKRLRKKCDKEGFKIRYLACGEYGPNTLRPHYHAIIFNYWPDDTKFLHNSIHNEPLFTSPKLEKIWGKGYIVIGNVNYETCAYVARYVMKKAYGGKTYDLKLMKRNKEPEFQCASRKPGLGYYSIDDERLMRNFGVPVKTQYGATVKPLPIYIRNKMRDKYRTEYTIKSEEHARKIKEEMRARKTDLNYFQYLKNHAKHRSEQLKRLDKRQDFEA